MASKGFCATFGMHNVQIIVASIPSALYVAESLKITENTVTPGIGLSAAIISVPIGILTGIVGFKRACAAHTKADRKGKALKTSAEINNKRAKAWQMRAFAITVGAGTIFNGAVSYGLKILDSQAHQMKLDDCVDGTNNREKGFPHTYRCTQSGHVQYLQSDLSSYSDHHKKFSKKVNV